MTDIVQFIEDHIPFNELGERWWLAGYQKDVLGLMLARRSGIYVWSEPKKSGKSHLTECVTIADSMMKPGTKTGIFANDSEQAESVIFKGCCELRRNNPDLQSSAKILAKRITFTNGSEIEWYAADYEGGAGHRRGRNIIDEPWAFATERMRRLYEELLPIPTIPDAYLWLCTTAGFSGEGELLEELYKRGLSGKRISRKYEVYRDKGLCMFWSHKPRQPWQTKRYYDEQRRLLRPNAFLRQHQNEWVSGESQFITAQMWDAIVDKNHRPILSGATLYHAIDIGVKSDASADVGVCFDPGSKKLMVAFHKIWRPSKGKPVSLDTVKDFVREIHRKNNAKGCADPSQAFLMIQQLWSESRIKVEEFAQTQAAGVKMGETLFSLIRDGNLIAYESPELREHVLNAVAVDTGAGIRMTKRKSTRKIDAAIALSMALCLAVEAGPKIFNPGALPIGVGTGIGHAMRREIGSTLNQPGPFSDELAEEDEIGRGRREGVHEVFRLGFLTEK